MSAQLDHLVIAAATLAEGVAWCEATLGVVPGPGGEHALFGTHNRLLKLSAAGSPNAYLEIIAIHPSATPTRAAPLRRWFDLDDEAMRVSLKLGGPQLIHWVVSVPQLATALTTWQRLGVDRGPVLTASRPTPQGLLQWQISVRDDGQRLFQGCLPTLIQWGATHPAQSMPDSGLSLQRLTLQHPEATALDVALAGIDLAGMKPVPGPARLSADLLTPLGPVTLRSPA
ncbi:VOC family protein [Hydrogenophaga sp.]|uniref:VOC family protein n=1 Tax=Hydrogenophaga sp. TaxID=1904254 RepID=UPI0025C26679|nr:VOC family protein [Hydrogenophaga sp.]